MSDYIKAATEQLHGIINGAFKKAAESGGLIQAEHPRFNVSIPDDGAHGDFSVNAALVSAKTFRMPPIKLAGILLDAISLEGSFFERCETAGPGFINFFAGRRWFGGAITAILSEKEDFGRSDYGGGERVMVEFVSANPTGPMHMGNARGAAIGDALAAVMERAGYDVSREFYVNDAGSQIEKFGISLEARYLQRLLGESAVDFPEDGYHGEDITRRAVEYINEYGDSLLSVPAEQRRQTLIDFALPRNVEKLRSDLEIYRVRYDTWFFESALHKGGIADVISRMTDRGLTYEKDGALWYKATEYSADKDEVLLRQNGHPTYFAADIAYHYNKFAVRGFKRVINFWGADHHGHVARMKGAMDALGLDGSKLDIVLMQLVRLISGGEPVKMSKRTGKAISLTDLLDEVPIDAARFFFNMREPGSALDFDLDLAIEQSSKNPVYYVQYAHARICSIIRKIEAEGVVMRDCTAQELYALDSTEEKNLIKLMAMLPGEIIEASRQYDTARLTQYAINLATLFHKFYTVHRVKGVDERLTQARLSLCAAARIVLRNLLAMLKISAPESM